MPERVQRHFRLAVGLTLASVAATEIAHHVLIFPDTVAGGLFLLGLVPLSYGALRAGFWAGAAGSLILAVYVLHYVGDHAVMLTLNQDSGLSFGVVLALGLVMSWPMSVIHRREARFRRELRERAQALERRNQELVDANAALEAFGFVVSHDLKEPVRAIENYLQAARDDWSAPDARFFVDEAHAANRRLSRMLQGLLAYSRASSGQPESRPLRIEEVVRSDVCRVQYERLYEERGAALEVAPDIPPVQGDEVLLGQLLGNLLLNATRHNPREKPRVSIASGPAKPGRVHIVVADDGPGYPPDVVAHFREAGRPPAATVKGGFGLVIAQRAARRLGGELWLENAAEVGARAHVELPAASAPAATA